MIERQMKELGLIPRYYVEPQKFPYYWFEENDYNENRLWIRLQMPKIVGICFLYFLFVLLGPKFMENRKPFDLKRPLTIWNFSFGLLSFIMAWRNWPVFLHVLNMENGFHKSACVDVELTRQSAFYGYLFTLSKIAELGDTVFIILRKKQLTFLHWFHHITILYCTTFIFSEGEPFSGWAALFNSSVHAIMYTYFGIMSLGIKIPRPLAKMLTTTQLLQFAIVFAVNMYGVAVLANGGECERTAASMNMHAVGAAAYFCLFLRFFINSYHVKPAKKIE